jgi:hypothetical protein
VRSSRLLHEFIKEAEEMGCAIFDFRRFAQTNFKLEKLALLF